MTPEQANDFLDNLKNLSRRERNYIEQIEMLDTMMTSITQKLNPNPASGHDNDSKIEKMMISKIQLEHDLLEYAYRLDVDRMQAMSILWKLPKVQGDILRDHYIFGKTYEDISKYAGYSERQVFRHREEGMKNFAIFYTKEYEI